VKAISPCGYVYKLSIHVLAKKIVELSPANINYVSVTIQAMWIKWTIKRNI
jgi:hypothetical protein